MIASFTFIKHLLFGLEIIGGLIGDYEAFNAKWGRENKSDSKHQQIEIWKRQLTWQDFL